jgi:hypothetical protein
LSHLDFVAEFFTEDVPSLLESSVDGDHEPESPLFCEGFTQWS